MESTETVGQGRNTLDCDCLQSGKENKKCGISQYGIKISREARDGRDREKTEEERKRGGEVVNGILVYYIFLSGVVCGSLFSLFMCVYVLYISPRSCFFLFLLFFFIVSTTFFFRFLFLLWWDSIYFLFLYLWIFEPLNSWFDFFVSWFLHWVESYSCFSLILRSPIIASASTLLTLLTLLTLYFFYLFY